MEDAHACAYALKERFGYPMCIRPLIAFTAVAALFGCAKEPAKPSEAEVQVNVILNARFRGTREFWFAQEMVGGAKRRLTEFHNPRTTLLAQPVTDTDRMNGISERYHLTLTAEQIRWWDGKWSDWVTGTGGGGKEAINALVGGLFGYWVVILEKKNGEWSMRSLNGRQFDTDKASLTALIVQAGT